MADTACEKSPTGRHQLKYREQARIFTDGNELRSTCNHCDLPVWRAHRGSAWWHAVTTNPATSVRNDFNDGAEREG